MTPKRDLEELARIAVGLLMNLGAATFREGVKRVVNNHTAFASSRLRVNQSTSSSNG
jgi:hypothetical protein